MKTVIIGAGRIGLGCAAPIAHRAGMDVVVLGRGPLVPQLNRHGRVRVRTVHGMHRHSVEVPLGSVDLERHPEDAAAEIASADLVCTAVGPGNFDGIAEVLAQGLRQATRPVDVVAFENSPDAAETLRALVRDHGADPHAHGFSGAVVDRVVAQRLEATPATPLTVIAEPTCAVVIDATGLVRDWSWLPRVRAVTEFRAWYRAKMYCYSAGHATAAYLGQLKGYRYLHAAVADPEIADAVTAAMREGRDGILHRYGPVIASGLGSVESILERFGNASLGDTVDRVGRDVPRKISRTDRLTGAARSARKADVVPEHLAFAIAAALHSFIPEVPAKRATRCRIISKMLSIKPTSELTRLVDDYWGKLRHSSALLSLHLDLPAWEADSPSERNAV
ncbi:hypothetical protein [Citricoccus sp. NR2]|uniref:mannitol dehydrogenase family protein n=1 Tax=Citricoccus sp. NR2 TaxID=3004095 RepID=UPI0022DD2505|nr:hypothetical protein [Citricoccus sp. NR2]WBL17766.1 hypothetical protein O1A05_08055 [Citricoccus sp. NR2]